MLSEYVRPSNADLQFRMNYYPENEIAHLLLPNNDLLVRIQLKKPRVNQVEAFAHISWSLTYLTFFRFAVTVVQYRLPGQ
jgi:hypothetical protein